MHFNDAEFTDLLEGTLPAARAAHLDACPACRSQVELARTALLDATDSHDPEPSPLFWETFPARVMAAVDEPPQGRRWFGAPVYAALALAAAAVVFAVTTLVAPEPVPPQPAAPVTSSAAPATVNEADDIDQDSAWAVVRTAAADLDYDDVLAEGISVTPGASEDAAMDLSEAERAELVRLIESEMTRTGA